MLSLLPDIAWNPSSGAMSTFIDILDCVMYMFPVATVTTIIGLVIALNVFRVFVSIIKTIWELLPLV